VPHKSWRDDKIVRSKDDYAGWAEQVAAAEHAPFIDLNELIARRYEELGPEKVEPLFADPRTHTSAAGAELNAQCVIAGLLLLKDDPLQPYLRPETADGHAALEVQPPAASSPELREHEATNLNSQAQPGKP
jgi:hypothetical protein